VTKIERAPTAKRLWPAVLAAAVALLMSGCLPVAEAQKPVRTPPSTTTPLTTTTPPTTSAPPTTTPPTSTLPPTTLPTTTTTTTAPPPGGTVAAAVRGINVSGYSRSDQLVTSAALRARLAAARTQYLRMPFRDGWADSDYLALLNAVKATGATPLVIIHGACGDPISVSDHWLDLTDSVFTGTYWVEYGNEEDLTCADATQYVDGWNAQVPIYKARHPRARFIGPVNYQYDGPYIQQFMASAHPRPDAISWHEYACNGANTIQYCLEAIGRWSTHASDMQTRMNAVGYRVPAWITEWNLDPNDTTRYQSSFVQQWTGQALAHMTNEVNAGLISVAFNYTLASHGSFDGSCSGFQLVCPDDTLTAQGAAFFG
jgi:hypothetical protein